MTEYEDRVAEAQRTILLQVILERSDKPLGVVLDAFDDDAREMFMATPLDELFEALKHAPPRQPNGARPKAKKKPPTNGARKPKRKAAPKKKAGKKKAKAKKKEGKRVSKTAKPKAAANSAPPAGVSTELIDAKILQAVRDNPGSKKDVILLKTGFSDSQFRTSTHRLITAGKIHRSGKTRGATYDPA